MKSNEEKLQDLVAFYKHKIEINAENSARLSDKKSIEAIAEEDKLYKSCIQRLEKRINKIQKNEKN